MQKYYSKALRVAFGIKDKKLINQTNPQSLSNDFWEDDATPISDPKNDYSDLGAVEVSTSEKDDYSDIGAVRVESK